MMTRMVSGVMAVTLSVLLSACSDGRLKSPSDWNKTEKGAVIGGASGAALGGIVGSQSGNAGTGALIGGAAGAAGGGLLGNQLDDQDEEIEDLEERRDYERGRY